MDQTCRMCQTRGKLTKHHLLLRRARAALGLPNATIWLCRDCHDGMHKGSPGDRRVANVALRLYLTDAELALLDRAKALQRERGWLEWWEHPAHAT